MLFQQRSTETLYRLDSLSKALHSALWLQDVLRGSFLDNNLTLQHFSIASCLMWPFCLWPGQGDLDAPGKREWGEGDHLSQGSHHQEVCAPSDGSGSGSGCVSSEAESSGYTSSLGSGPSLVNVLSWGLEVGYRWFRAGACSSKMVSLSWLSLGSWQKVSGSDCTYGRAHFSLL